MTQNLKNEAHSYKLLKMVKLQRTRKKGSKWLKRGLVVKVAQKWVKTWLKIIKTRLTRKND